MLRWWLSRGWYSVVGMGLGWTAWLGLCGGEYSWLGLNHCMCSRQGFGLYCNLRRGLWLANELGLWGRLHSWLDLCHRLDCWQGQGSGLRHRLDLDFGLSNLLGSRCRLCSWQGCGLWIRLHQTFWISSWQGLGFCLWHCRYLDLNLGPGLSTGLGHRCRLYSRQGCGLRLSLFLGIGCWLFLAWSLRNCLGLARPRLWSGLNLGFGQTSWLGYRCGLYS